MIISLRNKCGRTQIDEQACARYETKQNRAGWLVS